MVFFIDRSNDFLCDFGECDRHDVEHDEMDLPPEPRHAEEAREEGRGARRPQDEADEEGDDVELEVPPSVDPAPDEIHDEEDDERERDGDTGDVDRVREADLVEEGFLAADEEVVEAAQPVCIAGVQHDRELFACNTLIDVEEMERPPARVGQLVPVAVDVDELIVQVHVGILICRRKEEMVDKKRCVLRYFPCEADRLRVRIHRGRYGVVVGLPVKMIGMEADDVLIRKIALDDRVLRSQI